MSRGNNSYGGRKAARELTKNVTRIDLLVCYPKIKSPEGASAYQVLTFDGDDFMEMMKEHEADHPDSDDEYAEAYRMTLADGTQIIRLTPFLKFPTTEAREARRLETAKLIQMCLGEKVPA
jgi:hypothetical protein